MNCRLYTARELASTEGFQEDARYIVDHLTRHNSDFQQKLIGWMHGSPPSWRDGHIAVVRDHGEIVGWARTETWWEIPGEVPWSTLEAFVHPSYRGRGIAAFAASGLSSDVLHEESIVAVFAPSMLLLARRACLHPALFELNELGKWVRA